MRKTIRVALTVFFGLFALPALIFGLYLVACSIRIHTTNVYYVEYPYLAVASAFVALGVGIFYCAVQAAWRSSFYGLLYAVGVLSGLATMVYIPDGIPHVHRSMIEDFNYMSSVRSFLSVWQDQHHRFPENETEFIDALKRGPEAWQNRIQSPPLQSCYGQDGHRLSYQIVILNDASGPRLQNISDRPGVIYYAVSSDKERYWVTMTGLHQDTARIATLKRMIDRPDQKLLIATPSGYDYPVSGP